MYKTTEIASSEITSDNPVHQRLLFPYEYVSQLVSGNLLEIGCGTGRGVAVLSNQISKYTGVDKNEELLNKLSKEYPNFTFVDMFLPPLKDIPSDSFDYVVTFQVIEHIENDDYFLKEAARVLKPGGKLYLTTVNKKFSLTRNPWHVREYLAHELEALMQKHFAQVETLGVHGNEKVMAYYEENKKSVQKITRFDIFNLQYKLPRTWLQVPYDIANRMSRVLAAKSNAKLVSDIQVNDYFISDKPADSLDFFYIGTK
ncbi:class I SAM-dependent methyltransferase [Sandaracinomonas limnophila]|uniref:Class I SAM-dependent methyltransferase n=1 Tax=Sandaracinomonas limnophila TaxID=1862386 RepID=A0A437PW50_9BACT|nr:class I SAM-dependent methyltransferase [Sandaracinomonas limnophila]RVU26473.1 class I SAM-dependent methyltransferase [Sandaracinomonas limnophila]